MSSQPQTQAEWARFYRDRGWSVVPVRRGEKIPLVQWKIYQERLPTYDEIDEWWGKWPDANIAVICGAISKIVVIDVDPRHGGEAEPIQKAYPTGLVVATGGGGYHLVYVHPGPEQRVSPRTSVRPGVDIRGDGSYAVWPQSMHASGKPYEWVSLGEPGPNLPPWVFDAEPRQTSDAPQRERLNINQQIVVHERNDQLTRWAGYYVNRVNSLDELIRMVNGLNHTNCIKPLDLAEVRKICNSAWERWRTSTKGKTQHKSGQVLEMASKWFSEISMEEPEWLIQEWLPEKTCALVVGPPGSYKTWLLLDLAISVASGHDFLGRYMVNRRGTVLVYQQEDPAMLLADRYTSILFQRYGLSFPNANGQMLNKDAVFSSPVPPDIPVAFLREGRLSLDDHDSLRLLEQRVMEYEPRVVILDPLYSATDADDYMMTTAGKMLALKDMRDRYGCSFVIGHHTKKTLSSDIERADAWGSNFLNAWLETGWQIRPAEAGEDRVLIRRHFKATQSPEVLTFHLERGDGYLPTITEGTGPVVDTDDRDKIVAALASGPKSFGELKTALGLKHSAQVTRLLAKFPALVEKKGKAWQLKMATDQDGLPGF